MILNRISFVLSVFGFIIAAYLWSAHSHPQDIPCGITHGGCQTVANSPYSRFPIGSGPPVAAYGTFGYLAIIVLAVLRTSPQTARSDRRLLALSLLMATFGMIASLYLTAMEAFKIHAYCQWCLISQGIMAGVFILRLTEWFTWRGPIITSEKSS